MISRLYFNSILFRWYKKYGRHNLPWRKTRDPYRILVSEVMLQQTQVERVLPKYRVFLCRFPTITALARAPLGEVLRVWSGLGYNRRAKFLQECARRLIANRVSRIAKGAGARWPHTFSGLLALPGVGPSTAAAISSFAFGADEPMIDTNIRRVIARVFFPHHTPSDKKLYAFAKTLIPRAQGKTWNWAVVDVGALLCKAKGHSDACPFKKIHGPVGDFTYKKPQKKFAGSDRFYRGRILAALAGAPNGIHISALRASLRIPETRFNKFLQILRKESLVAVKKGVVALP